MLRQPIVTVLGHVDHGKTTLLDRIRQTAIASREAGGITQAIGTTEIPTDVIKTMCGHILDRFKFEINVPGLLFIDTPGHEAFTTLRKRGGGIADIAVLVIDIMEGIMPQTEESIRILKETKTPFIIALNKIDRIQGWIPSEDICSFAESLARQSENTKGKFEAEFYRIVGLFAEHGFSVERFDRVTDFTRTIAAVPVSGKSGEGIPELLALLVGLSQQYLKESLLKTEKSAGIVLEVKDLTGFGTTIDCIIYDGSVSKNDYLIVGGRMPMIAKIRALLAPEPLRDIRTEKKFQNVESVDAAAGVKIAAPGLGDVVAGSAIRTAKTFEEAETILEELSKEREEVEISTENEGLVLKADTIGSLEALISVFKDYPIKEARIGSINKTDIIKAEANTDQFYKVVVGFNASLTEDAEEFAKGKNVMIIKSDVIYRLIEEFEGWKKGETERIKKDEIDSITRAGKIKILPGCIFRSSNPAIVGCDVLGGIIKPGYFLFKNDGEAKQVGQIKQIQSQGQTVDEAKIGDKVAVSIIGPTVGRQINESDELYTDIGSEDYKSLLKNEKMLTEHEKKVMEEIKEIKRKKEPNWGFI
jgi:translation initiation factor 5B